MCFVLDVNSFHLMFSRKCKGYESFGPLRDWLYDDKLKTCIVYGGTSYKKELNRLSTFMTFLNELKKNGKVRIIQDGIVDAEEKRIKKIIPNKNFDDPHIVAIFCASGCRILATQDKRADKYIGNASLYPSGLKPPKVYRNDKNKSLLNRKNIVRLANES